MSRLTARELLRRSLTTGIPVAVLYLSADMRDHYREGRVVAITGSHFTLAYQDQAGTARRARFNLADPNDVLAVEPVR